MPLIGEELRTILGMMPVRDRAGIARGTMADDAMKASAAADGNAEGAALMQQGGAPRPAPPPQIALPKMGGPAPPGDIQLPANVPTAFASGRGGPAVPPAPQERVVAASPAAAPSRAVASASDAMIASIERRAQQQKMMQLVGSLGLIANAFNRNPQSQAATKASLADMVGGGGGKGGNELAEIKTIADMKAAEAQAAATAQMRAQGIGALRARGLSAEEAAVEYDSGQYKQRIGAEADEKERARASVAGVKAKLLPKIKELAAEIGTDPDVLAGQLETDPAKFFEQMTPQMRASVQKTLNETDKLKFENMETGAHMQSWANARRNPEEFMKRFGITDPAKAAPMLDDFGAMREFLKTSTPLHDEFQRKRADINAERAAMDPAKKPMTTEEVLTLQVPRTLPTAAEKGEQQSVEHLAGNLAKEHERVDAVHRDLTQNQPMAQELFKETQIGGSKLSAMSLAGRKLLGAMLLKPGEYDEKVVQSETFFNTIGENVLRRAKEFPGALSNDDRLFLEKLSGNIEMSPQSIRRLMVIREKVGKGELENFNKKIGGYQKSASEGMRGASKAYLRRDDTTGKDKDPYDMPEPGKFIQEDFANSNGAELLKAAAAAGQIGEPAFIKRFEADFGKGSLPFFREKAGV